MKKVLSLAVAIAMLLTAVAAFAEGTPSITTGALTQVVASTDANGQPVDPFVAVTAANDTVNADIAAMTAAVASGAAPVTTYTAETQAAVAEKLPEGVKAEDLVVNEFVAIEFLSVPEAESAVTFAFGTVYAENETVVAVVTTYTGAEKAEYVLDASVNADGTVKVVFPVDVMKAVEAADAASLAILSSGK